MDVDDGIDPPLDIFRVEAGVGWHQFVVRRSIGGQDRLASRHGFHGRVAKTFGTGGEEQRLAVPAVPVQDLVANVRTHRSPINTVLLRKRRCGGAPVRAGITTDVVHRDVVGQRLREFGKDTHQKREPLARVVAADDEQVAR